MTGKKMDKEKTADDVLIAIAKVLDELKIPYYVTGGFAVSVWGRPRFTADIDLIIKLSAQNKKEFAQEIKKLFPKGYLDLDQIDTALARQSEFNFVEPETGMKVDFWVIKNDNFDPVALERKVAKDIGYKVNFISPEDLILSKMIWFKETGSTRHTEDIESVLKVTKVDKNYLAKRAEELGLEDSSDRVLK